MASFIFGLDAQGKHDFPHLIEGRNMHGHVMMIGTTRQGRSHLIQQAADEQGISYEEMQKRLEPTPEQVAANAAQRAAEDEAKALRLAAARNAYWNEVGDESREWDNLHDALSELGIVNPTPAQCRVLFDLLPAPTIGLGISWGFTDSVVRDDIHRFAMEEQAQILAAITASEKN